MAEITAEVFDEKMDSFAKIVKGGFDAVDQRFDAVEFVIRSNHADVKEEIRRLDGRIDALSTSIDGFVKLHQTLEVELVAMRDKYNRVAKAHNTLVAIVAPSADARV